MTKPQGDILHNVAYHFSLARLLVKQSLLSRKLRSKLTKLEPTVKFSYRTDLTLLENQIWK